MRELAATIADATFVLRTVTLAQWLLRALTVAAIAGAAGACLVWFPFGQGMAACAVIVGLGLASVVFPDSWAPTAAIAGVAAWWVLAGAGAPWWQVVAVALLLAAFHLGTAICAAAPPWAHAGQRVVRRWFGTAGRYLALTAAGLGITVGVAAIGDVPWGTVWVVLGAGSLTAAALAVLRALHRD